MATPIKIIGAAMSPNVRKPLAVASQLGLDFEPVMARPHDDAVNAANPSGRIPAMDDNGYCLSESNAIMIYLAEKKPDTLYPEDAQARAKVNQWLCWDLAHWTPAFQPIQFQRYVKPLLGMGDPDEAVVEKTMELFKREAGLLNAALEGREWLVGDAPTLADFAVGCGFTYEPQIGLPLADYPNVAAWNERVKGLEGFKKTAPQA